jgi:hypothetical protein
MEIKIIAIAPKDGWGFIEKEEKLFLLRPPYTTSDQIEVSIKDLSKAIHSYGFEECAISLNSISETVKLLKEAYIKSKKNQDIELPSFEKLREGLKYAGGNDLLAYLTDAQEELIPEGKFDGAEAIASELLKLEVVRKNPKLHKMAIEIIDKCIQERKRRREFMFETNLEEPIMKKFPYAAAKYTVDSIIQRKKETTANGQLLQITG